MASSIPSLLGLFDAEHINETGLQLDSIYSANPVEFMAVLLETLRTSEDVAIILRGCSVASIHFPEISKLPDDQSLHPANLFGDELCGAYVDRCFELITTLPPESRHIPAVLLGKIAVHIVHRDFENNHIVERLAEILQGAQTVEDVTATSTALSIILDGYDPTEEEVQALVTAVFGHFTSLENLQVSIAALDIMLRLIESVTELLADPEFSETVASVLIALLESEDAYAASLTALLRLGKLVPALLADLAENVVLNSCKTLNESENENSQLVSCMAIRKVAKLEMRDQTLGLSTIKEYGEVVFMCLAQTMSHHENPDCVEADTWEPFVAAFQAMKAVLPLVIKDLKDKVVEIITQFVGSEAIGEIDAGLRILSIAIPLACDEENAKDPAFCIQFLEVLTTFAESEAPCLRQRAINCIKKSLVVMSTCNQFVADAEFKTSTIETATQALQYLEKLDDIPIIVSEVTSLMKVLTEIDGFGETEQIISAILERATKMRESFSKNPFYAFNEIIAEGPAEPAAAAFSTVVSLYQEAVSSEEFGWLVHELSETIQVYCYRTEFQEGVKGELETLVPLFGQVVQAGGQYGEDALIPLAALAKAGQEAFVPYLGDVLQIYQTIFAEHVDEPAAFYGALVGTDILINEGFEVPEKENIAALCAQQLANFDHEANVRTALMRVLSTLSRVSIEVVLPVLDEILPYLRVYARTLPVQQAIEREESDLMAFYLTVILNQIYSGVEPQLARENFEIAADVLRYYANFPAILKQHLISMIQMSLTMAEIDPDFILSQISIEEGIGNMYVDASTIPESAELAQKLLTVLHYQ